MVTAEHPNSAIQDLRALKSLTKFFEIAPTPMVIMEGPDLVFTMVNKAYADYVGRNVLGKSVREAYSEVEAGRFFPLLEKVYRTGTPSITREALLTVHMPDGSTRELYGDRSYHPLFDESGKPYAIMGIVHDTTDSVLLRKLAEASAEAANETARRIAVEQEKLRESELRFRTLTEAMPQMAFIAEPSGNVTFYNKRWYEYTGGLQNIEGEGWKNSPLIHPDDLQNTINAWQRAVTGGTPYQTEYRVRRSDGKYRWHLARATAVKDANNNTTQWLGTTTDIDELAESQREIIDTLESMSDMFFSVDQDWKINRVNASFAKLVNLKREEILGQSLLDRFIPAADYEGSQYWVNYHKAMNERVTVAFEDYYEPLDLWTDVRAYPKADGGLAVFFTDASERKRAEAALKNALNVAEVAKDEAERANMLKSAFLANMSHEIRTPLGAMMGFADLLREPGLSPTERSSYIDILSRNGESLSVIINDILDLSKVEAGHLSVEYTETFPDKIGADVISLLRVKAKEKDLVLEYSHEVSSPQSIVSDPTRVRQILLNLVGNAIKFTQFGSVKIRAFGCHTDDGRPSICFEVEDTGIGIPASQLEHIFEMFVQADGTMTRRFGGTGLGLALSRRLARALGGDVTVLRSREGFGTTFLVKIEDQPHRRDLNPETIKAEQRQKYEFTEGVLDGIKVLVVDDAPDNQQLIWRYLTKQGASVQSADNGLLGYRAALLGQFDIVLMDIQMPIMDGYTATQKLRDAGFTRPIIALTAHAMNEVRKKALNVGCTDQLSKPINYRELIATIAKYTGRG